MLLPRLSQFPLLLLLGFALPASAQDLARAPAVTLASSQAIDQTVYKGLIGNVLDAIPMDPSGRLGLQRTNAVLSNTLFGRSLAVLAGLSNPVLLVGGFVWGIWAASNITPVDADLRPGTVAVQSGVADAVQERMVALLVPASAADETPARAAPAPVLVSSISAADAVTAVVAPPRVFRVWLAQRSPAP